MPNIEPISIATARKLLRELKQNIIAYFDGTNVDGIELRLFLERWQSKIIEKYANSDGIEIRILDEFHLIRIRIVLYGPYLTDQRESTSIEFEVRRGIVHDKWRIIYFTIINSVAALAHISH